MPQEFAAPLTDWAVLAVTGEDAAAFLHGQFTNDVQALPLGGAQWNGWCSPKGRLLATFLLARRADGYLMLLPRDIAPAIAKRLGMFVLRSKVKIRDATADLDLAGIAGESALRSTGAPSAAMTSIEADGRTVVALDARRAFVVAPAGAALAGIPRGSVEDWRREMILAGIPVITAPTQDAFVPQMANFELVGGVSFRKGCYPGQEIVARTQYRGILKRRMALAHVEGAARPAPGESVYSPLFAGQAAGTVVDAAPAPGGGFDLLAVAQLESLEDGRLALGSPEGPALRIVSHPAAQAA